MKTSPTFSSRSVSFIRWLEHRAQFCEKTQSYREAITYWSKLLSIVVRSKRKEFSDVTYLARIHYHLGMNHQAVNDPLKSIYHLKYSIRLNSSEPRYFQAFGRAYLKGGHWPVAKTQFERAVRLDPTNTSYLRQYSWVLLMMGKRAEARLYARRAMDLNSDDPKNCWCLVRAYMESKMYSHALVMLRELRFVKDFREKAQFAYEECLARVSSTLEGAVLEILKIGMKLDGRPFHIAHFRWAQDLWHRFVVAENPHDLKIGPHAWAGALAWQTLESMKSQAPFTFDEILDRFSCDSQTLWPVVFRLRDFCEIQRA
jgi:tetratricopeptide (TPR) repeat protein